MPDLPLYTQLEDARSKRAALGADPQRPHYHFVAPAGWLNDPNGLLHWRGEYHLFYQHNPFAATWGPPYWGHAVSGDLVHWRDLPVAIWPDQHPVDGGGCWSGCAVVDNGVPTLIYTGVADTPQGEQRTCLAFGSDDLLTWQKHAHNPVLRRPADLAITQNAYRDPYVWREGDAWYQVTGTSLDERGQALLYRSADLKAWDYLGPLIAPDVREQLEDDGHTWECPNFFALGDKHVLIVSVSGACLQYPLAFVGEYRDGRFYPETTQRVDWGYHCFYAPLTMQDASDRRLMWGWLQEQRSEASQIVAGWSGIMSLPRVLSLRGARLHSEPAPELEVLRQEHTVLTDLELSKGLHVVPEIEGRALELKLRLALGSATRAGLVLALSDDEREGLYLTYDRERAVLNLEPRSASREQGLWSQPYTYPLELQDDRLELHVFLDGSAAEVFAGGTGFTCRHYAGTGDRHVALYADGAARVERLEAWRLGAIWSTD